MCIKKIILQPLTLSFWLRPCSWAMIIIHPMTNKLHITELCWWRLRIRKTNSLCSSSTSSFFWQPVVGFAMLNCPQEIEQAQIQCNQISLCSLTYTNTLKEEESNENLHLRSESRGGDNATMVIENRCHRQKQANENGMARVRSTLFILGFLLKLLRK